MYNFQFCGSLAFRWHDCGVSVTLKSHVWGQFSVWDHRLPAWCACPSISSCSCKRVDTKERPLLFLSVLILVAPVWTWPIFALNPTLWKHAFPWTDGPHRFSWSWFRLNFLVITVHASPRHAAVAKHVSRQSDTNEHRKLHDISVSAFDAARRKVWMHHYCCWWKVAGLLFSCHTGIATSCKRKMSLWQLCEPSLFLHWTSQASHPPQSEQPGMALQLQTQLGTSGAPGSFMEGRGIVRGNEAGRTNGGRMYILKQRGCLLSLATDPTCRWSTQSPGRSKSQGPGWTSLWNGNGA